MTETVNYTTGEIAAVDTSSEVAVTGYLQQARDWLATAVESTGPEQIAMAKAEIATAAEATKQLGLSKEIRDDATEMVRRAEYALGKSIRRGQAEGTIGVRETSLIPGGPNARLDVDHPDNQRLPRMTDYASRGELYGTRNDGVVALADADSEQFETAITEAKAEGNLSRANVVRKIRGDDPTTERKHQEAELINAFRALLRNLTPKNISTLSPKARGHLVAILRDTITKLEGQS